MYCQTEFDYPASFFLSFKYKVFLTIIYEGCQLLLILQYIYLF